MLITIVSKDKLSLSMFIDFFRSLYDSDVALLDLNINTSTEMLNSLTSNFIDHHAKRVSAEQAWCIIKLKTRGPLTFDRLPLEIAQKSSYIIQFDLFSSKPELLKDLDGKLKPILDRWEANIKKFDGIL
jgi:hypothetical protein